MIKIDMSMPKNCLDCPACNEYLMCAIPINGRKWGENDVREFGQGRPEWCPMKEQEKQKFFVDENGKITPLPVVVRCKDCIKRKTNSCLMYWNGIFDDETWDDDWFCADGKYKEGKCKECGICGIDESR